MAAKHRPSRWWALLGVFRCAKCGEDWQCEAFTNAADKVIEPEPRDRWPTKGLPGR